MNSLAYDLAVTTSASTGGEERRRQQRRAVSVDIAAERRRVDRRRGRPPKADVDHLKTITTAVSASMHATLKRIARDRDLTLSEVVRRVLAGRLGAASR